MSETTPGGGTGQVKETPGQFSMVMGGTSYSPGAPYIFYPAPESVDYRFPARTQTIPTLTAAYTEHFGPGIASVTISGSFGWRTGETPARATGGLDPATAMPVTQPGGLKRLRDFLANYQQNLLRAAGSVDPSLPELLISLYDPQLNETFFCVADPTGLRLAATRSSPLLYRYTLSLTILYGKKQSQEPLHLAKLDNVLQDTVAGLTGRSFAAASNATLAGIRPIAETTQRYETQAGDTLRGISLIYGVSVDAIARRNGIVSDIRLPVGTVLVIPDPLLTLLALLGDAGSKLTSTGLLRPESPLV